MWSGPRNLSTAMMYSFGNRADVSAIDEPFYGAYLKASGADHPMRDQTLSSMETDAGKVAQNLKRYSAPYQYEKHMTHHMLEGFPLDWMAETKNVFLIRHPKRVLASYRAKREKPKIDDLGFVQQARILEHVIGLGQTPIIIDSSDIRRDPKAALTLLCSQLSIPFDDAMLKWPAGPRPYDGAWAPHWYGSVHSSTGFSKETRALPEFDGEWAEMIDQLMPIYEGLAERLTVQVGRD